MECLSVRQVADKWQISKRRVQTLCSEGRIYGAMRVGNYWVISADADKTKDDRN